MTWRIPLCRPVIGRAEERAVRRVLRSGNIANGPLADKFAQQVAKRHGLAHGVAVSSGTLGLELSLRALGVGPGDRVACPAYTFVASANAILAVGAKPVFCDVDEWGIMRPGSPTLADKIKAAVVVDLFGTAARPAGEIFHAAGVPVVEDACEAIGNPAVGYGDLVVFGFFPNKQITTGEGGVVCRGRDGHSRLTEFAEVTRNHGRGPGGFCRWGTNARMSEIHAAIGLEQMKRLTRLMRLRRRVANWYLGALPPWGIRAIPDGSMSWFVFPVWFDTKSIRDRVRAALTAAKIQTGDYFPYLPTMPQFGSKFTLPEYPVARRLSDTGMALPFFPAMTKDDVRGVVKVVRGVVR